MRLPAADWRQTFRESPQKALRTNSLQTRFGRSFFPLIAFVLAVAAAVSAGAKSGPAGDVILGSGWQLQDVAKVPQAGAEVAAAGFNTKGWYTATVPDRKSVVEGKRGDLR